VFGPLSKLIVVGGPHPLGGSAIHMLDPFRSRGGGVERLSPVGRRPRDPAVAKLIDEDRAPVDPVAVVDRGLDDGKIAAGDDPSDARPPGEGPVHRPAALAAGDALTGLRELNDRVLVKLAWNNSTWPSVNAWNIRSIVWRFSASPML
jgi:hypothetical protein